jgi:pimeloyl-ACP methyl ester carboxylesterase
LAAVNWILLRGLTREQSHWGDFRRQLAQRFPDHRYHCIDLPGTGTRFRDRSPSTIAGIRRCVQDYAAGISGPVGLLGVSMGGMVALDWAQADPARVASLVLINTSTGFSPPWRRMRPTAFGEAMGMALRQNVEARERGILQLTSNRPVGRALEASWLVVQRQRPVTRRTALAQVRAAATYRPGAEAPAATGLLLASAGDRIVHWHCSRALARRWHWPLRIHPDAGHDLPLDAPDWVLEQFPPVA